MIYFVSSETQKPQLNESINRDCSLVQRIINLKGHWLKLVWGQCLIWHTACNSCLCAGLQGESDIWSDHMCRWHHWCESWTVLFQSTTQGDPEGGSARVRHRSHRQRSVPLPGDRHVKPRCRSYLGKTLSGVSCIILVSDIAIFVLKRDVKLQLTLVSLWPVPY